MCRRNGWDPSDTACAAVIVLVSVWAALATACAATTAAPVLDITAMQLACVDAAKTAQAATDCRNAVRIAWGKANGVTVASLDGGSSDAAEGGQ